MRLRHVTALSVPRLETRNEKDPSNEVTAENDSQGTYFSYQEPFPPRIISSDDEVSVITDETIRFPLEVAESRLNSAMKEMKGYLKSGGFEYELFIVAKGSIGSQLFKVKDLMKDKAVPKEFQTKLELVQKVYDEMSLTALQISRLNEKALAN